MRATTDSSDTDDNDNNTKNAMRRNETSSAPSERDALLVVEQKHFNVDQVDDETEASPIMVDAEEVCAPEDATATSATATTSLLSTTTTGQRILQLAIPAAGALLIDPLLTVTDTAFVGRFTDDGAAPLAGMGSAAALLTFSFYLFNFLCTATTPLVAERRAAGDAGGAVSVGGQALSLGLALGVALAVLLTLLRQPLLTVMGTGQTGANEYALQFLSVRALAAPAVLTMEAATGVLRGYLDTVTPIRVLVASNIVNLALDGVLIVGLGLGPLGAAVATTTAEWISAGLFLLVLAGRLPSQVAELGSNRNNNMDDSSGSAAAATSAVAAVRIVPIAKLPPWSEIRSLLVASSSVFFRTLILQLSLSAAAAMAARSPVDATSSVAAHQIGIQLWLLCSFFCDSLAAASQGLVADALGRKDAQAVVDVSNTIFVYSLILGLALAAILQIGTSTGLLLDIFTQDGTTKDALYSILPLIVVAQPLNSLVFAADGVIQGASEFSFQAGAMIISGATAVGTFALLEMMASGGGGGASSPDTLFNVWVALIALQLMRGLTSLYKLVDARGPINLLRLEKPI